MFEWSIIARAWRSASKRAITWPGIHAGLDDFERDAAADRRLLLGHVHHAHAPFADLLQELVGADQRAGLLGQRWIGREKNRTAPKEAAGSIEQRIRVVVRLKQRRYPRAQCGIAAGRLIEVSLALAGG